MTSGLDSGAGSITGPGWGTGTGERLPRGRPRTGTSAIGLSMIDWTGWAAAWGSVGSGGGSLGTGISSTMVGGQHDFRRQIHFRHHHRGDQRGVAGDDDDQSARVALALGEGGDRSIGGHRLNSFNASRV